MATSVYAIIPTIAEADRAVETLRLRGYISDDISLLFPDKHTTPRLRP